MHDQLYSHHHIVTTLGLTNPILTTSFSPNLLSPYHSHYLCSHQPYSHYPGSHQPYSHNRCSHHPYSHHLFLNIFVLTSFFLTSTFSLPFWWVCVSVSCWDEKTYGCNNTCGVKTTSWLLCPCQNCILSRLKCHLAWFFGMLPTPEKLGMCYFQIVVLSYIRTVCVILYALNCVYVVVARCVESVQI